VAVLESWSWSWRMTWQQQQQWRSCSSCSDTPCAVAPRWICCFLSLGLLLGTGCGTLLPVGVVSPNTWALLYPFPLLLLPPCKGGGGVCQHGGEQCLLCVLKCALPRGDGCVCQATIGWGHPICVEGFFCVWASPDRHPCCLAALSQHSRCGLQIALVCCSHRCPAKGRFENSLRGPVAA
jgi:hypothetical protein